MAVGLFFSKTKVSVVFGVLWQFAKISFQYDDDNLADKSALIGSGNGLMLNNKQIIT